MSLLDDLLRERFGTHAQLEAERFAPTPPPRPDRARIAAALATDRESRRGGWLRLRKLQQELAAHDVDIRRAS